MSEFHLRRGLPAFGRAEELYHIPDFIVLFIQNPCKVPIAYSRVEFGSEKFSFYMLSFSP